MTKQGIHGEPSPIHYCDNLANDRWCLVNVIDGEFKGETVCLIVTFKDKSIVDLGSGSPYYDSDKEDGGFTIVEIPNKYLDFNLEAHLETNRLIDNMEKKEFITKDSGERLNFQSGMMRDIESDKPRFDLLIALEDSYENCLLTRWAAILTRGANKYAERNWEKANSLEEFKRFKSSAFRHFMQLMCNQTDEDHFAAVVFNLNGMVYLMNKLNIDVNGNSLKKDPKQNELLSSGTVVIVKDEWIRTVKSGDRICNIHGDPMGIAISSQDEEDFVKVELIVPTYTDDIPGKN